jgi:putative phage-type endonuclease
MNDLEDLKCILETLVFEDEPSIFTEDNIHDFVETALLLMDEFMKENPTLISEPDFDTIFLEEIKELFYIQFEEQIFNSVDDSVEDDMDEILESVFQIYLSSFCKERSFIENFFHKKPIIINGSDETINNKIIETKINHLRNIPQPIQRTDAWYEFRHNLITASNAYKAFESQATINQLIYEKCQPLKTSITTKTTDNTEKMKEIKLVNTNTTLHWGQKYEPLSVMLYETMYKTKVEDFGCIQHPEYKFLGASPDGIIVDPLNERYGRMLEIKNIVNREINGIPKKEYWVQMQLQMEVCDLDECDFLETKFVEYPDRETFLQDQDQEQNLTKKGIIIYFHRKDGTPYYEYKPLDIATQTEIEEWEEQQVAFHENTNGYIFMKTIYWKLEKLSCVLVLRNKEWFKNNIPQLQNVWNIIEKERISGYEHRAPNRKPKKEHPSKFVNETQGCLLPLFKKVE